MEVGGQAWIIRFVAGQPRVGDWEDSTAWEGSVPAVSVCLTVRFRLVPAVWLVGKEGVRAVGWTEESCGAQVPCHPYLSDSCDPQMNIMPAQLVSLLSFLLSLLLSLFAPADVGRVHRHQPGEHY